MSGQTEGEQGRGQSRPFPFRTLHIFFLDVDLARPEVLHDKPVQLELSSLVTEIAYGYEEEKERHNVNLRVSTEKDEDSAVEMKMLMAGVFEFNGEGTPTEDEISEYVNERLLPEMVSRLIQMVALITGQMGMVPVWLPTPSEFTFSLSELFHSSGQE